MLKGAKGDHPTLELGDKNHKASAKDMQGKALALTEVFEEAR